VTDKSVDQLLANLHSVQMAVMTVGDNNEQAIDGLFTGAIDMIMEHDDANHIIAQILLGMTQEIKEVTIQLHTLMQAIDRADAFVLVVVGQLLALIEQNNIDVSTEEQRKGIELCTWVIDLIAADTSQEDLMEKAKQMDELYDLYLEVDRTTDPNVLRKIVNDE
jgi:hypothetical protein